MAYYDIFTARWKSQHGNDYVATVSRTTEPSGSVARLIASAEPLDIEMSADTTPEDCIHKTTATLRFINEDYDYGTKLDEMIPATELDVKVSVTRNGEVIFVGFVSTEIDNQAWDACPYEVEVPIRGFLDVADDINIATDLTQHPLSYWLSQFMATVGATSAVFPDSFTSYLSQSIKGMFLMEENDDEDETTYTGISWGSALEKIFKACGLMVAQKGEKLYFYYPTLAGQTYTEYTQAQLADGETSTTAVTATTATLESVFDNASNANKLDTIRPYRKIKVKQSIDDASDSYTLDVDSNEITKWDDLIYITDPDSDDDDVVYTAIYLYATTEQKNLKRYAWYNNGSTTTQYTSIRPNGVCDGHYVAGAWIVSADVWGSDEWKDKDSVSISPAIAMYGNRFDSTAPQTTDTDTQYFDEAVVIESDMVIDKNLVMNGEGGLCLDMSIFKVFDYAESGGNSGLPSGDPSDPDEDDYNYIPVSVQVGSLYWDGEKWCYMNNLRPVSFVLKFKGNDLLCNHTGHNYGLPYSAKNMTTPAERINLKGCSGYVMPFGQDRLAEGVTDMLEGTVKLTIYAPHKLYVTSDDTYTPDNTVIMLKDVSLKFCPSVMSEMAPKGKDKTQTFFPSTYGEETEITLDTWNGSATYETFQPTGLPFWNTANANQHAQTRRKITLDNAYHTGDSLLDTYTYGGRSYRVLTSNQKCSDDGGQVELIELLS